MGNTNAVSKLDYAFMDRAISLATNATVNEVSPNPLVGCVIVRNNTIIGKGWHKRYGEAHAEVNAINSVEDKSLLASSTLYVTLEPCFHYGKTPPCVDLILEYNIPRVVVGIKDPNPKVAGKSIEKLLAASVEVQLGILAERIRILNSRFLTCQVHKRPYVILKWAMTEDGFIARKDGSSKWITDVASRTLVHKWRAEEGAILVGTNTVRVDNPRLDVRLLELNEPFSNPTRVIIDKDLSLPKSSNVLDGSSPTVVFTAIPNPNEKVIKSDGCTFVYVSDWGNLLVLMLDYLYKQGICSLFVEGGAKLLNSFIKEQIWDEARVFLAPICFNAGLKAPDIELLVQENRQVGSYSLPRNDKGLDSVIEIRKNNS